MHCPYTNYIQVLRHYSATVIQFFILKSGLIFENSKAHARRSERCQKEVATALKKRERKDRANIFKGVSSILEEVNNMASRVGLLERNSSSSYRLNGGDPSSSSKVHPDADDSLTMTTPESQWYGDSSNLPGRSTLEEEAAAMLAPSPSWVSDRVSPRLLSMAAREDLELEGPDIRLMLAGSAEAQTTGPATSAAAPQSQLQLQLQPPQSWHAEMQAMRAQRQQEMEWREQQNMVMQALLQEVRLLRQQSPQQLPPSPSSSIAPQ